MVRYSDIIKKGIKKKGKDRTKDKAGPEKSEQPKKTGSSLRFSTLEKFGASSDLNAALPAQKDAEYMQKLHRTIVDYLEEVRKRVKNDERFDIKPAVDIINLIINTPDLIEKFYHSTALSNNYNNEEKYLILHLINVMVYALKVGTGLKYSREELLELGLAALLYDIGLFNALENITEKRGTLTKAESDIMKNHTEIGKNILSHFHAEHPMMPRVAYEHHERKNGSGYPEELTENEICEHAKIIGLLDTFDAMIHNRPYRKALGQYFVVKELVESKISIDDSFDVMIHSGPHKKALAQHFTVKELVESKDVLFSPRIIKVFLDEMGIFPVGCYVRLNNMEIGKVIATSKDHPMRPTIKMMFDNRGKKVSEETAINLKEHPILYVTGSVNNEEDLPSNQVV